MAIAAADKRYDKYGAATNSDISNPICWSENQSHLCGKLKGAGGWGVLEEKKVQQKKEK